MKRWMFSALGLVLAMLVVFTLWRLADHDLDHRASETFAITTAGERISGTIWLPEVTPISVVAIVHGDGAQDRTSSGGYVPLINAFLDRGIAIASWDKPGVGLSEGNWLLQSMPDRAAETRAVLAHLKARFDNTVVGAMGFSQAGWVLQSLTRADADFLITVGAAVSWQDQGDYYTTVRLRREGLGEDAITAALSDQKTEDERIFGPAATPEDRPAGMPRDRWQFVRQNRNADSREALATLDIPLLAIWGADDLNVNPVRNAEIFRELLTDRAELARVVVVPNATHGLLKSSAYSWQLLQDWSHYAVARFLFEGRYAYAPDALGTLFRWVEETAARP